VRAWTAPPSRGLRGGFARGDARLCCPLEAPSPDEDSASFGPDPSNQGEPKPRWNDESQRPSRLLRPNQFQVTLKTDRFPTGMHGRNLAFGGGVA